MDRKQIQQWLKNKTITSDQAAKMLADSKSQRSNKLVTVLSTIGALLFGMGALLFIASNWQEMSNGVKILLLLVVTFGSYYLGYYFRYQKKNLPRSGSALLFLGALLFGASIFLIAQMYHVEASYHVLILIWILGILPLVYVFLSPSIAALAAILAYVWLAFFLFQGKYLSDLESEFIVILIIFSIFSIFLFQVGALHYMHQKLGAIARVYRLVGLKAAMFILFLFTFEWLSGGLGGLVKEVAKETHFFVILFVTLSVLTIILTAINQFFNPSQDKLIGIEGYASGAIIALMMIFYFFPSETTIYTVIFNLVFAGLALTLLLIGYNEGDIFLVNMGMFWFASFILAKYFDFFWDLLPRSMFFMTGGLILVLGGIALEKKRRQLKAQWEA